MWDSSAHKDGNKIMPVPPTLSFMALFHINVSIVSSGRTV